MGFQLMTSKNSFATNIFGNQDLRDVCSVSRLETETFFYCNEPEDVKLGKIADAGYWFTKNTVGNQG